MERLLGVAPMRASPIVGQAVGLPRVEEISKDLDDMCDESESDEVPDVRVPAERCFLHRGKRQPLAAALCVIGSRLQT